MHRRILQAAIVVLCIWHMFCVLVFSLPRETSLRSLTTPYMWMTIQWQLRNVKTRRDAESVLVSVVETSHRMHRTMKIYGRNFAKFVLSIIMMRGNFIRSSFAVAGRGSMIVPVMYPAFSACSRTFLLCAVDGYAI